MSIDSYERNHKEFLKNHKSILKTQQRLKVKGIIFLLKKLITLR